MTNWIIEKDDKTITITTSLSKHIYNIDELEMRWGTINGKGITFLKDNQEAFTLSLGVCYIFDRNGEGKVVLVESSKGKQYFTKYDEQGRPIECSTSNGNHIKYGYREGGEKYIIEEE